MMRLREEPAITYWSRYSTAAQGGVHAAKLEADVAAANDEERCRYVRDIERVSRVHHPVAVERERGDARRLRAGCQNGVLEPQLGAAVGAGNRQRARPLERGAA